MEAFAVWMSENPRLAAVVVVLGFIVIGVARVVIMGDRVVAARRDGEDEAKDHHNDMIASNRSEESELNRARRSVGDWIKRVRGGQ